MNLLQPLAVNENKICALLCEFLSHRHTFIAVRVLSRKKIKVGHVVPKFKNK